MNLFKKSLPLAIATFCSLGLAGCEKPVEDKASTSLTCTPQTITLDDTLTINLGMPHMGEMAIVRPDKDLFFIANRNLEGAMPSSMFKGISTLQISVRNLMAHRFRAGAPEYEVVFDAPGTYKMIFGDVLESDAGHPVQTCEVVLKK